MQKPKRTVEAAPHTCLNCPTEVPPNTEVCSQPCQDALNDLATERMSVQQTQDLEVMQIGTLSDEC